MSVIPRPQHITALEGSYEVRPEASITAADPAALETAEQLAAWLRPATGFTLPVQLAAAKPGGIHLELGDAPLGNEGYILRVKPEGAVLQAKTTTGLFYAAQSFRQLLPSAIFSATRVATAWVSPALELRDAPRFPWRGLHLDTCRHFMPLLFIKKLLDLMALHKLNTFHWHLSDDQGWRLEIKRYPKLTEVGAWRNQTRVGHELSAEKSFDATPHGGFYTQAEAREIVDYAAKLHITVLPEIEMPGHAQAAIAAYPELGNTAQQLEVCTHWGIIEHVFNPLEPTIEFLQNVLLEVMALFPSAYIHVGGDECPKREWRESVAAQTRLRELGLNNEDELQSYIIGRMDSFLHAQGRKLIGWDEILEGGLAPNATVMSWRGAQGGIHAAKTGHDVVMTDQGYVYFDHYQTADHSTEPLAIGGFTPLEKVYRYDPIPESLTATEAQHILGAQAQLWTEYIPSPDHAEYMLFPRLCALSESVWTPAAQKDWIDFRARMNAHRERLERLGVHYHPLEHP